jgi:hypothetical protein
MAQDFSPDIEAWIAYLLVALSGGWVARRQVRRRLADMPHAWRVPHTWFLFLIYLLVPILLYWVLDRTSAIIDTSMMSALLVGFGYERIMAGTNTEDGTGSAGVAAPGPVRSIWAPLLAYADEIAAKVRDTLNREASHELALAIKDVAADPARLDKLAQLARVRTADLAAFDARIKTIDDTYGPISEEETRVRKTRAYMAQVMAEEDYKGLLAERGVIDSGWWQRASGSGEAIARLIGVALIVAVLAWALVGEKRVFSMTGSLWSDAVVAYRLWRIEKPNATDANLVRARDRLGELLADPRQRDAVVVGLARALQAPGLSSQRADRLLQVLVANRAVFGDSQQALAARLIDALHADSPDVRTRINNALLFLAGQAGLDNAPEIARVRQWSAQTTDTMVEIEEQIVNWRRIWKLPEAGGGQPKA